MTQEFDPLKILLTLLSTDPALGELPDVVAHPIREAAGGEVVRIGLRLEGITDDARPEFPEPDAQPGPLETGMAGDQDFYSFEDI